MPLAMHVIFTSDHSLASTIACGCAVMTGGTACAYKLKYIDFEKVCVACLSSYVSLACVWYKCA